MNKMGINWGWRSYDEGMAGRPQLELGTAGGVRLYPNRAGDGFRARALYRDLDGRTRHVERTGKSRGAAQRALATAIRDRARASGGAPITSESIVSVVAELWFGGLAEAGRSPSTMQVYRDRLDNQIIPTLGSVRLRELSVGLVDRHLRTVRTRHGNSIAKQTKSVLSGLCSLATRYDALESNPCRDAIRISSKAKRSPRSMTAEEVRTFLRWLADDESARKHDLHALVSFMVATGLRIGEALGVTWSAIDLSAGTVEVRGTLLRVRGEGLVFKPTPKSAAGERILELPTWATIMLRERAVGDPEIFLTSDPLFASAVGGFRDPANTRRALRYAFAATAGTQGLSSHAFRKTVATLMDEAGLSARQAADQLGHAKPSMTADVYYGRRSRATGAATVLEDLF